MITAPIKARIGFIAGTITPPIPAEPRCVPTKNNRLYKEIHTAPASEKMNPFLEIDSFCLKNTRTGTMVRAANRNRQNTSTTAGAYVPNTFALVQERPQVTIASTSNSIRRVSLDDLDN